jgi:DNA-binding NarL/FixJ family response regulator
MIRVVLVDDHAFLRSSVRALLTAAGGIEVVGECADGSAVSQTVAASRPHVVLMDEGMPVVSGLAATRALLREVPGIAVLMLTVSVNTALRKAAAEAGAAGHLTKGGDPEALVQALRTVASGHRLWPA